MSDHPYRHLPDAAFWRKSVAQPAAADLDPVVSAPFRIAPTDKVVTAGSCFAQHIARHLAAAGFNYLVTETAHPIVPSDLPADLLADHGYGIYSARYGNIYTPRQLLQLLLRAHGQMIPREAAWREEDGLWTDPFRPQIQPGRFHTLAELEADRAHHFGCVRRAFAEASVFVFTLGLTESWVDREDGSVYPLCPGVAGGRFDAARHAFHNFSAAEITADLLEFVERMRGINPGVRVVLTVSPVPLVATAAGGHALVATTYSKAVLRVAADEVARRLPNIAYFPSFEIVTGHYSRGAYFAPDLRSVTEEGVAHVMRVFLRHYTEAGTPAAARAAAESAPPAEDELKAVMKALVKVNCDEEALDR